MKIWRIDLRSDWVKRAGWGLFVILYLWARVRWPVRALDSTGPAALRDLAFTLILWLLSSILCFSIGMYLLRILSIKSMEKLEKGIFAFALGFGAIAYWILLLGFVQLLNLFALAISMVAVAILVAPEATRCVRWLAALPGEIARVWRCNSMLSKAIVSVTLVVGCFSVIHSLYPAVDYDGLMYHLVGPKLFLDSEKIFPFPDNWYINEPFTIEMFFSLGLVFRDDVFPKLIHFSFGALYLFTTYLLARRLLKPRGVWLSVALIMGIPTLPILATYAYIDFGWSFFEVLSILALLIWLPEKERSWLILSGLMSGLGMGSKYLGLMGFGIVGMVVIFGSIRGGWRKILSNAFLFGLPAVLVASPWYLKNIFWFGNPVYPLYFGGPGWQESRLDLYETYLQDFGGGKSVLDLILLPINIYLRHTEFSATFKIDIPNPLFLLVLLFPLIKKNQLLSVIFAISTGRLLLWFIGSQQTRFLMPIFPLLSILTAYVIQKLFLDASWFKRFNYIPGVICTALMIVTLYYQIAFTNLIGPFGVLVGQESKESFLLRNVGDYPAIVYIRDRLPHAERVLFIVDGRGYHCLPQCIPDPDHFRWAAEITALDTYKELGDWFSAKDVNYFMLCWLDIDFVLQHDPKGVIEEATEMLSAWNDDGCIEEIFKAEWVSLYEVKCSSGDRIIDLNYP